jgi:hypothetical protein
MSDICGASEAPTGGILLYLSKDRIISNNSLFLYRDVSLNFNDLILVYFALFIRLSKSLIDDLWINNALLNDYFFSLSFVNVLSIN